MLLLLYYNIHVQSESQSFQISHSHKKPTKEVQRSLRFIQDPLTLFYSTTYLVI